MIHANIPPQWHLLLKSIYFCSGAYSRAYTSPGPILAHSRKDLGNRFTLRGSEIYADSNNSMNPVVEVPVQSILEAAEELRRRVERCLHTQLGASQFLLDQKNECIRFLQVAFQVCCRSHYLLQDVSQMSAPASISCSGLCCARR